ncbi:PAS domain-containing hybrid sensor histidine kinase/response regulator [Carboxylicivirga sp. M1479]|uniref:PAS domain-containing sensor histidine kinase n=1 Tax=Carboxylicivirga sp. M1479 TaxID=2594476 RepID=UPI001196B248|nr:PAS domain-containing hybrid sensor histidine kinase/response regulator [Carboxylicivirga sp. M1479]TRX62810.1 hypothetical protein FNN09_19440 [Carboxylicivirga sp. M1479]
MSRFLRSDEGDVLMQATKITRGFIMVFFLIISTNIFANTWSENSFSTEWWLVVLTTILALTWIITIYYHFSKRKKNTKQTDSNNNLNTTLSSLIESVPLATCIINNKQQVLHQNKAYKTLIGENNKLSTWDQQLKIDYKKINLTNTDDIQVTNADNSLLKIHIKPLLIDKGLHTLTVESNSDQLSQSNAFEQWKNSYNSILHNTSFSVIVVDSQFNIIDFNKHVVNLLKASSHEISNCKITKLFTVDEQAQLINLIGFTENQENTPSLFNIKTFKNTIIPVEIKCIPFDYFSKTATLCLLSDVSERLYIEQEMLKAKRRAEESDRLKSSFLANMSHEVRTPLNSIMGFTELMSDEQVNHKERKEFHNIVKASSNELLDLLNDIMEFSKIESGLIKIELGTIDPHELINDLSTYASEQLKNNPNVRFNISEPLGLTHLPTLISDKRRVKQVLKQLIENAVKFTYEGHITLAYQYRSDSSIEFIISDTGIGIPQEKIPNIFHKFRQANDDNSRDFGGAGLGLSICKHLANVLGGFLWVSSIEQKGSDFHFIIPSISKQSNHQRYSNTVIFYSSQYKKIPQINSNTRVLPLFAFEALVNVPLAINTSVILLDDYLNKKELSRLLSISQIRSTTIIQYSEQSEIIHSPIAKEIGFRLNNAFELNKYIDKCISRKIND